MFAKHSTTSTYTQNTHKTHTKHTQNTRKTHAHTQHRLDLELERRVFVMQEGIEVEPPGARGPLTPALARAGRPAVGPRGRVEVKEEAGQQGACLGRSGGGEELKECRS